MPSLERFFDPQIRKFDLNVKPLPGARFYFFENGTTTPKTVYQDKAGTIPHTNPVIADASGSFAPIFLDGLYRVELRSNKNIVQPGWPIDNVGQDAAVVPFGPWVEILPYNEGEIVTGSNGNWYRSIGDNNLGNDPTSSPEYWEVIPIPVASSFTSNQAYLTWSDDGEQISLDVDIDGLGADVLPYIEANITGADGDFEARQNLSVLGDVSVVGGISSDGDIVSSGGEMVIGDARFNDQGEISVDGGSTFFPLITGDDSSYKSFSTNFWMISGSVSCVKVGSLVIVNLDIVAGSSIAGGVTMEDAIPSDFIPPTFLRKNIWLMDHQNQIGYSAEVESVVGTGHLYLSRSSTVTATARGTLTFCYTV